MGLPYRGFYDNLLIVVGFAVNGIIIWQALAWRPVAPSLNAASPAGQGPVHDPPHLPSNGGNEGDTMTQIIETIDVDVPVTTAYNQWTQFESFPHFLDEVEQITQIDDTHQHWKVKVGGAEREFDTEITEQHPDERVAWKSIGGDTDHAGVVTFHKLTDTSTRVTVQLDWEPEGALEKLGVAGGCRFARREEGPQELQGVHREAWAPRPAPGAETCRRSA